MASLFQTKAHFLRKEEINGKEEINARRKVLDMWVGRLMTLFSISGAKVKEKDVSFKKEILTQKKTQKKFEHHLRDAISRRLMVLFNTILGDKTRPISWKKITEYDFWMGTTAKLTIPIQRKLLYHSFYLQESESVYEMLWRFPHLLDDKSLPKNLTHFTEQRQSLGIDDDLVPKVDFNSWAVNLLLMARLNQVLIPDLSSIVLDYVGGDLVEMVTCSCSRCQHRYLDVGSFCLGYPERMRWGSLDMPLSPYYIDYPSSEE